MGEQIIANFGGCAWRKELVLHGCDVTGQGGKTMSRKMAQPPKAKH